LERANLLGTSEDNLYIHVTDYTPTAGLCIKLKALERHSLLCRLSFPNKACVNVEPSPAFPSVPLFSLTVISFILLEAHCQGHEFIFSLEVSGGRACL
jgi:hypothetical protein